MEQTQSTAEALVRLEEPFASKDVKWLVAATSRDGRKGRVTPYADPRAYTDRLNEVVTPSGWTREYTVHTVSPITRMKKDKAIQSGKVLATCAYMAISLALSLAAFVLVFRFVHLERIGMSANVSMQTAAVFFAICLPFVPLGAALMTFVASFTRTYREAQTYLSLVLLVPTMPIVFASIYSLKPRSSLMWIPSLSQHLLMTGVLKDERLVAGDLTLSAAASLTLALVFGWLTKRQWERESLLG